MKPRNGTPSRSVIAGVLGVPSQSIHGEGHAGIRTSGPISVSKSPGSERTACRKGVRNESPEPLAGCLGAPAQRRHLSRRAVKFCPDASEDLWGGGLVTRRALHCRVAAWKIDAITRCTKRRRKPDGRRCMPGASLSRQRSGEATGWGAKIRSGYHTDTSFLPPDAWSMRIRYYSVCGKFDTPPRRELGPALASHISTSRPT